MDDAYLLELLAWAHSSSSLTCPTPRGAPTIDRLDVLAAIGGSRATLRLADGRLVADVTDAGPELVQLAAGVGLASHKMIALVGTVARAAVERLLSRAMRPDAELCGSAAQSALFDFCTGQLRGQMPNGTARGGEATEADHAAAAWDALQDMYLAARSRFGAQIAACRPRRLEAA